MTYLEAIFKVLVVGLVLGAGLPAVFAGGLVAYSQRVPAATDSRRHRRRRPTRR